MKKKIICLATCFLMISIAVLPAVGTLKVQHISLKSTDINGGMNDKHQGEGDNCLDCNNGEVKDQHQEWSDECLFISDFEWQEICRISSNDDVNLDQYQWYAEDYLPLIEIDGPGFDRVAQGFTPTMEVLTDVWLLMRRDEVENPAVVEFNTYILNKPWSEEFPLGKATVNSHDILDGTSWVQFHFDPPIKTFPDMTYYIVQERISLSCAFYDSTYINWFGTDSCSGDIYQGGIAGIRQAHTNEWIPKIDWDYAFCTYGGWNERPYRPRTPVGPLFAKPGDVVTFKTNTRDPDGDKIRYYWDWGDESSCTLTDLYDSGVTVEATHEYLDEGEYHVKVKAIDKFFKNGAYSFPITIQITPFGSARNVFTETIFNLLDINWEFTPYSASMNNYGFELFEINPAREKYQEEKIYSISYGDEGKPNQYQLCGESALMTTYRYQAQMFRPTVDILTKVRLLLSKEENVGSEGHIMVYIKDVCENTYLEKSLHYSDITKGENWVTIDFDDIEVVPYGSDFYYIELQMPLLPSNELLESSGGVGWCYRECSGKTYQGGEGMVKRHEEDVWYKKNPGNPLSDRWDFAFEVWGRCNERPHIPQVPASDFLYNPFASPSVELRFETVTEDPDGDKVKYLWDWGDDSDLEWTDLYDSGVIVEATHEYLDEGEYEAKVKAIDSFGKSSEWSSQLLFITPYGNLRYAITEAILNLLDVTP